MCKRTTFKTLTWVIVAGLALTAVWYTTASADDEPGEHPRRHRRMGHDRGGRGDQFGMMGKLAALGEELALTDEQKAQIHQIVMDGFQRIQDEVLTDEQKAKLEELKESRGQAFMDRMAERLELTEDQQAEIEAIMATAKEQAEAAETREAKWEIMKAAFEQVKTEVLNEEQQAKVDQMFQRGGGDRSRGGHGQRMAEALGLTEDQQAQVEAIMTAAREEAGAAETREAKMEIMKAAFEQVKTEVLTEEQQAKAEELHQARRQGHGARGEGGGCEHGPRCGGRCGGEE